MTEENQKEEKKDSKDYPAKEQGIEPKKTSEEIRQDMDVGEKEEDPYTKEGREKMKDEDEMDAVEEGFMEGASGGGQLGKDALTGEPLMDIEDTVELQIKGKMYRFVNEDNAQKFKKKKEEEF